MWIIILYFVVNIFVYISKCMTFVLNIDLILRMILINVRLLFVVLIDNLRLIIIKRYNWLFVLSLLILFSLLWKNTPPVISFLLTSSVCFWDSFPASVNLLFEFISYNIFISKNSFFLVLRRILLLTVFLIFYNFECLLKIWVGTSYNLFSAIINLRRWQAIFIVMFSLNAKLTNEVCKGLSIIWMLEFENA
jgi:hypothetical protein